MIGSHVARCFQAAKARDLGTRSSVSRIGRYMACRMGREHSLPGTKLRHFSSLQYFFDADDVHLVFQAQLAEKLLETDISNESCLSQ